MLCFKRNKQATVSFLYIKYIEKLSACGERIWTGGCNSFRGPPEISSNPIISHLAPPPFNPHQIAILWRYLGRQLRLSHFLSRFLSPHLPQLLQIAEKIIYPISLQGYFSKKRVDALEKHQNFQITFPTAAEFRV